MSLWDSIRRWADRNAEQYVFVFFPDAGGVPLRANESYFRLWMGDMFLTKSRSWFTDWFPSVTSSVRLKFGDHPGITLTHIARAPQEALARGVLLNYPVTELLPFRGGVVEMEGALLAMRGANHLQATVKVLGDFAQLVTAPIGEAIEIANRVTSGIDELVSATDGQVHLALHQAFADSGGGGENVLRPGYMAVVLSGDHRLRERLSVVDGRLHHVRSLGARPEPVTGYDYILYRIEGRQERDDWRLRNIEEPLNKAIDATLKGEAENAQAYRRVALAAALTSPDLAIPDRRRVALAIKEELAAIEGLGRGALPAAMRDLDSIMAARAIPVGRAAALGEMSLEQALS